MITKFEIVIKNIFLIIVFFYFLISSFYFLQVLPGGDETLFISDLEMIKSKGWFVAIEKNISIPYMILVYPIALFVKNYIALRIVSVLLLILLGIYFYKRKSEFSIRLYGYFLFLISTVGYFFFGTNDGLFFIGLIVFIHEVYLLQKNKNWNGTLALVALIIAFFTRALVVVYAPVILICLYVIFKEKGLRTIKVTYPLIFLSLFLVLNIPSFLSKGGLSYDLKSPPSSINVTWGQRQYLAQLLVNKGELANYNHPSWEQTRIYLENNGEESLPKGVFEGLFFDIELTIKEFFKDLISSIFLGFRQLGIMLFIPVFFLAKDIYKNRKISLSMLLPISLVLMIGIFSLIIISYVELRWLAPFFVLSIVYFSDLQKNNLLKNHVVIANYIILISMSFYGMYKLFLRF